MPQIRLIEPTDVERCVEFGLESFRPVFASFEEHYGAGLFNALRPDWERAQSEYIREACSNRDGDTWVAEVNGEVVGFVVLRTNDESHLGQIELMAVDPDQQGQGVGTALADFGVDRLRELGMTHAIVGTGNDPGHAPARKAYLKAGFEPMAIQPVHMVQRLRPL